jgi:RNA polymerase sigma factor (sigma-70 family)
VDSTGNSLPHRCFRALDLNQRQQFGRAILLQTRENARSACNDLRARASLIQQDVGSSEEAEDVLQRFSVRALERSSDLRDVRTVRAWLGRILASTIVDHQRRAVRKRRRAMENSHIESLAVEPDIELDGAICNCLYKLLPTLKADYAEVVWRADILGEPRDRIAASLGATLNNVTVRLHRGRQALKRRLEEMCLTCPAHGFLDCRCDEAKRIRQQHEAAPS